MFDYFLGGRKAPSEAALLFGLLFGVLVVYLLAALWSTGCLKPITYGFIEMLTATIAKPSFCHWSEVPDLLFLRDRSLPRDTYEFIAFGDHVCNNYRISYSFCRQNHQML